MRKHGVHISGKRNIPWMRTKTFTTTYVSRNSQLKVAKSAKRKQWLCMVIHKSRTPLAKSLLVVTIVPNCAHIIIHV